MNKMQQRRYNRLAQQKTREGKASYVTQIENLKAIIAFQAGVINQEQVLLTVPDYEEVMDKAIQDCLELMN